MNSRILDFQNFKLMLESVDTSETVKKEIQFGFNFDSGLYKKESIPQDRLTKLKANIVNSIKPTFNNVRFVNQKVIIELEASTSTLGIKPELAAELKTQPGTAGNVALCDARMKTMESIIVEALTESLNVTEDKLRTKVQFAPPVNKANQGGGATPEEQKKFQYIKTRISITGDRGEKPNPFSCSFNATMNGVQGKADNNYVGYGQAKGQLFTVDIPIDTIFQVSFDPLTIPDCFFMKYGDTEFLSPFLGAPSFTDGKGKTYNYVDQLAALPDLKDKINAELALVGATGTVDTLRPDFFNSDGKVNVKPGPRQKPELGITTFQAKREFLYTDVIIRVFSPLSNTQFSIRSGCSSPTKE